MSLQFVENSTWVLAGFSDTGDAVAVAAPGVDTFSTLPPACRVSSRR